MSLKRRPLLFFLGSCLAVLLAGLIGSTTAPTVALADGAGGDTIPAEGIDSIGGDKHYEEPAEPDPDQTSTLDLFLDLLSIIL